MEQNHFSPDARVVRFCRFSDRQACKTTVFWEITNPWLKTSRFNGFLCNGKRKYITFFCHCTETRHYIESWYVLGERWRVKGYVVIETIVFFNIVCHSTGRVLGMISDTATANVSWSLLFNPSIIITINFSFLLEKPWSSQSPHIPSHFDVLGRFVDIYRVLPR